MMWRLGLTLLMIGATSPSFARQPSNRVVWRDIPPGTVTLGDNDGRPEERPAHQLRLPALRMMLTEATVAQYRSCMKAGGCTTPRGHSPVSPESRRLNWGATGRDEHPINGISWAQASDFCRWAGGRLPTEAEWVRGARKREQHRYPWGDGPPAARSPVLANLADATAGKAHPSWKVVQGYDDGFVGTAPVASFAMGRSAAGLLDVAGNVWEWTADRFDPEGYRRPKRAGAPNLRAVRGGAFNSPAARITTQARRGLGPKAATDDVGVRCVAEPQASRKNRDAR
ncbi:MAG: formylglycine-generating enzyme family protein [Myxococcota bacterium]